MSLQRDPLLATKLFAPRPPSGFVPRPHLVDKLNAARPAGGLTLVCAPAGFGKTALVADWARQRPVAWLTLDPGDNDPTRFWRHALAALDGVRPGTAERVEPAFGPPAPQSLEGPVTVLINDLASESDQNEIVLALDNYQAIDSKTIHDSVSFLVEHLPPGLRLVILSRIDPPLAMARLRAGGRLVELRADDLRFNVDEAAALLGAALHLSLPDATVATLAARTEGWAAGLRLAALSLEGRPDAESFVQAFSGSHRYVLDYLTEEVLERQPEPVRRFLLETSVLPRLSGELCDAVTGRTDGRTMLDAIDRANLFVVPLDDVRQWWRYHQLFGDLLRARLEHEWPDRVPDLHRNAAAWYARRGLVDDAIGHALAAGDANWAVRLIEPQVGEFLLRSEEATLERWLAALPAELVAERPRLLLGQADLALARGNVEAVVRALDGAERAFAESSVADDEPSIGNSAGLLANVPAAIAFWRAYLAELRGDADGAVVLDRRALAELGDADSILAPLVRKHLHTAELARGELRDAERDIRSSIAALQTAGQIYPAMRGIELLGHVQRAQGRLDAALETYREGLEISVISGRAPAPSAGIAYAGMAEVAYQRGELDLAFQHAVQATTLCRSLAYRRPLAAALATLARVRWAEGDRAGAMDALAQDPHVATSVGVTSLLNPIPALYARLMLSSGDLASAARWINERGIAPEDQVSYPREPEYLVLARVLLAEGHVQQAVDLLDRLHALADRQGRVGNTLEIDALRAVALAAAGDAARALSTLSEALALGQRQDYTRVFIDEGEPMRALLVRVITAQRDHEGRARRVPLGYLSRLLRALEPAPDNGSGAEPTVLAGLVEPLSDREHEVLRLLAAGKPNQEIAAELFVALDTVKKHVSHILAKLGATNRTEATSRARELGLLGSTVCPFR